MRLIQFPLGIFGIALATAILPTLSAQAARGDQQELRKTLEFGLRMIWFIILPAMLGLILLRVPIIHLFFEHGAFSPHDTQETASALFGYAVGLWAFAGVRIIVSAFYSMKDTKTPALTAFGAMVVNITLSVFLMGPLEHVGLALATAISAMVNISILLIILNHRLGGIDWVRFGISAIRTIMASVPLVLACLWVEGLAVWDRPDEWIAKGLMLFVGIGLSVTGYIAIQALFRSEELDVYWQMIRKKFIAS
jgi:putative peptidoglycan lipid II flippase